MPSSQTNQPRRTLLLTGASRGIRHATVKRFSRRRLARDHMLASSLPRELSWEDRYPRSHPGRPSDEASTLEAIAETKRRLDGHELHALVSNRPMSPKAGDGKRLSTLNTSEEDQHHVFQINFFAPIMLARGLVEELKTAKGSVVNISSIAGSRVHPFAGAACSDLKAALAALTREMASDFGRLGIRVNAIAPGEMDPVMLSPAQKDSRANADAPAG